MTYPLPTRTGSDTAAEHVEDHNEIHSILGLALPTGLTTTGTGHLNDHVKIHRILNTIQAQALPTTITSGLTGHLSHHNTIHDLLNAETYGPRGTVGQTDPTTISGWVGSGGFTSSHSTFVSLQSAVTDAGTNRVFRITASMAFTAIIAPHANDEFWFDDGVTITRSGAITAAFKPSVATSGVKIMNGVFTGFNSGANDATIDALSSNSWEIGNCEISNGGVGTKLGASTLGSRVHHCYIHDCNNGFGAFGGRNHIFEDNEYENNNDLNKFVATQGIRFRHNYAHNCDRSAAWFDTSNTDSTCEWNIIEGCGASGLTMGGICHESDYWVDGTVTAPDVGTPISESTKNEVCYNKFVSNVGTACSMYHSSWTDVHGNTFYQDTSVDPNTGSIDLEFRNPFKGVGGSGGDSHVELKNNSIHHNYVIQTTSTRKAVRLNLNLAAGADAYDTTPYISNTKNNNFDYNVYELNSSAHTAFRWPTGLAAGTNNTFAVWNTINQGASGTGTDQDIHGERV